MFLPVQSDTGNINDLGLVYCVGLRAMASCPGVLQINMLQLPSKGGTLEFPNLPGPPEN